MACSRFEYVKAFERDEKLLPGCWGVIRLDGRTFTSFSKAHNFRKPNDQRALQLMNSAAEAVLSAFDDHIVFAYGESDEYSFILKRESQLFSRRHSKILSTVLSLFTSAYVFNWPRFMTDIALQFPPSFDARIVLYPTTKHLRDYLSWRQADTHVNNLFNTAFWALVDRASMSNREAEVRLKGTTSKEKNEILFSQFGINYNNEPIMFRKGSLVMKNPELMDFAPGKRKREIDVQEHRFVTLHVDIIGDTFWQKYPHLLAPSDLEPPRIPKP